MFLPPSLCQTRAIIPAAIQEELLTFLMGQPRSSNGMLPRFASLTDCRCQVLAIPVAAVPSTHDGGEPRLCRARHHVVRRHARGPCRLLVVWRATSFRPRMTRSAARLCCNVHALPCDAGTLCSAPRPQPMLHVLASRSCCRRRSRASKGKTESRESFEHNKGANKLNLRFRIHDADLPFTSRACGFEFLTWILCPKNSWKVLLWKTHSMLQSEAELPLADAYLRAELSATCT